MKVGIIGAMDQEVALLRAQMSDVEELTLAGCEFFSGTLAGQNVVLTRSGIGKVAAAVATTLLLDRFAPDCVINTGSAGGFDPELHIGDVVISSEVRHHDVDVTGFGYEIGQVPRMPAAFIADERLKAIARAAVAELQDGIQSKEGLVCTGDQFMCDPARIAKAREDFPTMTAVEMEGAAIAQVCHQFDVPFVVTRSLSDIAGKESPDSFDAYLEIAARNSSIMVMAMLKRM
jgi:adenosylhomocysteine nucleosidase